MWTFFQSADVTLNALWAALTITTVLQWLLSGRRAEGKREILAILFILVLLFPVVSTADDIIQHAMMYEPAASPLLLNGGVENKQFVSVSLPAVAADNDLTVQAPLSPAGEDVTTEAASLRTLLLSSTSGIHSPPQF